MVSDFLGVPRVALPVVWCQIGSAALLETFGTHCTGWMFLFSGINDVATDFGDDTSNEELVVNPLM